MKYLFLVLFAACAVDTGPDNITHDEVSEQSEELTGTCRGNAVYSLRDGVRSDVGDAYTCGGFYGMQGDRYIIRCMPKDQSGFLGSLGVEYRYRIYAWDGLGQPTSLAWQKGWFDIRSTDSATRVAQGDCSCDRRYVCQSY